MEAQIAQFTNRGMNQDISISKATNEFAFENYNIRITAVNDNTLLSVSNEKMPIDVNVTVDTENNIKGTYLGYAILNNYLVLFTKADDYDRIYRLEFKDNNFIGTILYKGDLQFDNVEAVETLVYYESEAIQKVYWVDGKNQPRFINIVSENIKDGDDEQFDFAPKINMFPKCNITKNYEKGGLFPSGVIQYFASYYNKYGAETGIVWASDLQYITEKNRGEAPDKNIICSFELEFTNLDFREFEYIKVYSVYRTSYNGQVVAQLVADKKLSADLIIVDDNLHNEIIDANSLFFLGGSKFIAETLTQKDNTLFFGGITDSSSIIPQEIKEALTITPNVNGQYISPWVTFSTKKIGEPLDEFFYDLNDEEFQLLNSEKQIKTFKFGEIYRFAIQFQDSNAFWTAPIWIGDAECNIQPTSSNNNILVANAIVTFDENLKLLFSNYYSNYRLLIAEASNADRKILAQGVVSPTVFNFEDRTESKGAYALSSWITRPRKGNAAFEHMTSLGNQVTQEDSKFIFENLETCEIQSANTFTPTVNNPKQTIGPEADAYIEKQYVPRANNYYVDSSIITFHSPEIENNIELFDNTDLVFNIVGITQIDRVNSDIDLQLATPGLSGALKASKPKNQDNKTLTNDSLFKDYQFLGKNTGVFNAKYYLYLWNKSESIIGQTKEWEEDINYATLKSKVISNYNISVRNTYIDKSLWGSIGVNITVFNSDQPVTKTLKSEDKIVYYQANYEKLLTTIKEHISEGDSDAIATNPAYRVFFDGYELSIDSILGDSILKEGHYYDEFPQYSPVSIKYKSTPHIVFSLGRNILPYLKDNGELPWKTEFEYFYNLMTTSLEYDYFPWFENSRGFDVAYNQSSISGITCSKPYLFLGELSRNIDYNTLYGGTDKNAIERITWIPASNAYNVEQNITLTYGDTYYQRYDCLKTYPYTREDQNSVVDITSFMVETHINLAGRYDKHKELNDIINVDNTNFSQINDVYSQPNNFFSYNILDEKFDDAKYLNQIVYSLNKIPTGDIDLWTSTTLSTAFNLDGSKGNITKLLNFNDTIIAFQDKAISAINFNNRTALSTESGVPIEIANSGKVNGYSIIIDNVGCQNKQSICQASSGVYFIDDLNKTLYSFNKEGLSNISSKGLSIWFKDNLTNKEKIFYDNLTHDLYITNKDNCITYNEELQSFVSFMDYKNINLLFNLNGESFLLNKGTTIIPKKLFGGNYTNNYYVKYKINPEPLLDKTFTHVEFIASVLNDSKVDDVNSEKTLNYPFTQLKVWNEYQQGTTNILYKHNYPKSQKKFRIWRIDVPRDSCNQRDRIRNPWMMLELLNSGEHNNKMVFHNLLVKYYK